MRGGEVARGSNCSFCEERLTNGEHFCGGCGRPTPAATNDERVLWELGQWEASRQGRQVESRSRESAAPARVEAGGSRSQASVATKPKANAKQSAVPASGDQGRRSLLSRFRKVAPPDAVPAGPVPARPMPARPSADPALKGVQREPAAAQTPEKPAARATTPAPKTPRTATPAPSQPAKTAASKPAAAAVKPATPAPAKPAAPVAKTQSHPRAESASTSKAATQTLPRPAPPRTAPEPKRLTPSRPVVERRQAPSPRPVQQSAASTAPARPVAAPSRPAVEQPSAAPSRPATPPPAKPQTRVKPAKPERAPSESAKRDAQKRERRHKRHTKRVSRKAASLDLKKGENVILSIEGWSRFRRATLVMTNYRVALITRVPPQVRWIPLEEVSGVSHRWRGAHSLLITGSIEVLTLQKRKREMLSSFEQFLHPTVTEALRPGNTQHHHADITQEWCDRATEIWDSRSRRVRLWIRRRPTITFLTFIVCVSGAFFLTTFLTSLFSPYR